MENWFRCYSCQPNPQSHDLLLLAGVHRDMKIMSDFVFLSYRLQVLENVGEQTRNSEIARSSLLKLARLIICYFIVPVQFYRETRIVHGG